MEARPTTKSYNERMTYIKHLWLLPLLALCVGVTVGQNAQAPLSIGIAPSMLKDLTDGQQTFISGEFPLLVKQFTGLDGKLARAKDVADLAQRVEAGTDPFGVFQGVEFAWIRVKHPELKPLLISVYHRARGRALLVVKKDSAYAKFADLRGKNLSLLRQGKEHCRLFAIKGAGGDFDEFFGKVVDPPNAEAALDAILLGTVDAAIVDDASLDIYKDVNPGRHDRLKIIAESPLFPPGVIVHNPKKVAPAAVEQFRVGMLNANRIERGRDVMSSFKITAFEAVPAEFETWLAEILKEYPTPPK